MRLWCIQFRKENVKLPPIEKVRVIYTKGEDGKLRCILCGKKFAPSQYAKHYINFHYDYVVGSYEDRP